MKHMLKFLKERNILNQFSEKKTTQKLTVKTAMASFYHASAAIFPDNKGLITLYDIRPRGYKTFSMLNSIEHEIFPAHKS